MRRWTVEGMFPVGSVVLLSGETGSGKSWMALDLVRALLSGGKWLNEYECDQGSVQYMSGGDDTYENTMARLIGLEFGSGGDPREFLEAYGDQLVVPSHSKVAGRSFPLSDGSFRATLLENLAGHPQEILPVGWVFDPIGTLVQDINDDAVREIVVWSKSLAQVSGGISLLINHLNVKRTDTSNLAAKTRGNEFWRNLADHCLEVQKDEEDDQMVHVTWSKSKSVQSPGGRHPAFSIRRTVTPLSPKDNDTLLRSFGLDPADFPPQTTFKATLWHRPYEPKDKNGANSEAGSDLPIAAPETPPGASGRESRVGGAIDIQDVSRAVLAVLPDEDSVGLDRGEILRALKSQGLGPKGTAARDLLKALRELRMAGAIIDRPGARRNNPVYVRLSRSQESEI